MLVTCSACSAKFQLPDDKIAGRRARMKCKTCGAPIAIDGTSLRPRPSAGGPPPPPSRRPSAQAKPETLSFTDQTVALGAEEAEALSSQSRRVDAPPPADLEDRITPMSNPRAAELLDDGYVDEAMSALEEKVFSVPAPRPAPAAKAAAVPLPAPGPLPAARAPSAPATLTAGAKGAAPKAAPAKGAPTPSTPAAAEDEEATRMLDLPRMLSGAPAPSASTSQAPSAESDEEATRMLDLATSGAASLVGGKRLEGETDEATRIFDADPAPRGPRLPPRPSLPRPASAPGSAPSAAAAHSAPANRGLSSASEAPAPPASATRNLGLPAPDLVIPAGAPLAVAPFTSAEQTSGTRSAPSSLGAFPTPDGRPVGGGLTADLEPAPPPRRAPELTVQRARISSAPALPARSNWGLYLFVLAVAATGTLLAVYIFARPAFDQAIASTRHALGIGEESASASGPAFNAQAASAELARVAALTSTCKQPSGPTGAGRARVLFQMSGVVSSAAISAPFHDSASETCLLGLFKSARVPRFGGHPVIVTKTFRIE